MAKDRAQDLLNEMAKLREHREKFGSVDLSRIKDWKLAERVARSLLSDAGLELSKKRHVQAFLVMVAAHLHLKFESGTPSKKLPIDNLTLMKRACASFKTGERETTAAISRKLHESPDLNQCELNAVRTQLWRIVVQGVEGQKIRGITTDELAALMPTLRKIKVVRRAKPAA